MLFGATISYLSWHFKPESLYSILPLIILVMIFCWGRAQTPLFAFAIFFGYYLEFAADVPFAYGKLYPSSSSSYAYFGLIFHAVILALPWYPINKIKSIQLPIILLVTLLPPFGIINWGHPLLVSGLIFPGLGFVGIILTGLLFYVITINKTDQLKIGIILATIVLVGTSISSNIQYQHPEKSLTKIGIDTNFKGGMAGENFLNRYSIIDKLAIKAIEDGYKVIIFPEEIIDIWFEGASYLMSTSVQKARENNVTILVGANIGLNLKPYKAVELFSDSLVNPLTDKIIASARVPMPVGNWRLTAPTTTHDIYATNVVLINKVPTSIIFCYEELLIYPVLFDSLAGAKSIIAVVNDWTVDGTKSIHVQARSMAMTARMFGLLVTTARNK